MNATLKKWIVLAAIALLAAAPTWPGTPDARQRPGRRLRQRQRPHRGHRDRRGHQAARPPGRGPGRRRRLRQGRASRWRACRWTRCRPSAPRPWRATPRRSTAWPAPRPRWRCARATCAPAQALVAQRESELDAAQRRLARSHRRWRATAHRRSRSWTTTAPACAAPQARGDRGQGPGRRRAAPPSRPPRAPRSPAPRPASTPRRPRIARIEADIDDSEL